MVPGISNNLFEIFRERSLVPHNAEEMYGFQHDLKHVLNETEIRVRFIEFCHLLQLTKAVPSKSNVGSGPMR